jgi:2-polyprenyl-3-methyl-5-hydroxy-6-metoxy-1,4-benzoquinol methylase
VFSERATTAELLDEPDCDLALAAASYRFMELVNAWFGGIRTVRRFVAGKGAGRSSDTPLRVLDIGSGSCDIPLAVSRWARARGIALHITCLEPAEHAAGIARARLAREKDPAVDLLQESAFDHQPAEPYDCAVSSMCFHHFDDGQILALLGRLRGFVRDSVLINDLRRSRVAALAARLLLLGSPAGVRHDALLSIRRGFRTNGLGDLLRQVGGTDVQVRPVPWFRIAATICFQPGENR